MADNQTLGGRRESCVFVTPGRGVPFIDRDQEILDRVVDLTMLYRPDYPRRGLLARTLVAMIRNRPAFLYVWFAEPYDTLHLLRLAKVFGVPSAVVVGGYELANMPEVGYGALRSAANRRRLPKILELADLLLPTSKFLTGELAKLGASSNVETIELGIDGEYFSPVDQPREELVITVARITAAQWQVKGLDVFAKASRSFPNVRFVALGPCEDSSLRERLLELGGDNFEVPGDVLDSAQVRDWMRRARVYAQLSARETFGAAVAESMACGCQVVTSRVGSLPNLVDDTGRLVEFGDVEQAVAGIRAALDEPIPGGRERILGRFDHRVRETSLKEVLERRLGVALSAGDRDDADR